MKLCSTPATGETASESQDYCLGHTSAPLQTPAAGADKGRRELTKTTGFSRVRGQSINEPALENSILVLLPLE